MVSGLTVEQVAERLFCSPSKISRLETGQRRASHRDIRDLCDLYRVDSGQQDYLAMLAEEAARPGWWQPYDLSYATYVGLESAAIMISYFQPGVFPGLLQTPAYTRALHDGALRRFSPDVIDQQIEVRRVRQEALTRDESPQLSVVLDEAVLHRVIGSPKVMAEQIQHVIEMAQRDNVSVQVLPYSIGAHPALDSTFILLEFAPPVAGIVYVEGLAGKFYLERPEVVRSYKKVYVHLASIALSLERSVELMAKKRISFLAMSAD